MHFCSALLMYFLPGVDIEQIADGHQPPELTAQALTTGVIELPVDWQAQRRAFAAPV